MKAPEPSIEELIARQIDGLTLTSAQRRELQAWLEASEEHRSAFLRAYDAWGESRLGDLGFDTEEALRSVLSRIEAHPAERPLRQPRRLHIAVAAAAVAAAIIAAVAGFYGPRFGSGPDIESFVRQTETPVFTREEVQLVLSERKTLLLEEKKSVIRYDSAAIRINNAEKTIPRKESAAFNQLVVPYGRQSALTLSDGTRVWINAGSRLIYPVVFGRREREIYVEGEVYMEVARDEHRPFFVRTDKMEVSVLGTRFYVSCYGPRQTHEVVLLSGSVGVAPAGRSDRAVRIVPGEQALLGASGPPQVNRVEAENSIGWIHGYLPFRNERLENIAARLSRYYNRRIECTPEAAALTLSGKLELKDDPDRVLQVLSLTAPIRIEQAGSGLRIAYRPTADPQNRLPM